jgi:hypothetical protein
MSSAAPTIESVKAVEHALECLRGKTWPIVLYPEQGIGWPAADTHSDGSIGVARVTQRVLDQVADQLAQTLVVAVHHDRLGLDRHSLAARQSADDFSGQQVESQRDALELKLARAGFRQQQQVAHQTRHPIDLFARFGQDLAALGRRQIALEQIEVASNGCQRGAQLVRRVGQELLLRLEHIVDARHHLGVGPSQAQQLASTRLDDPHRDHDRAESNERDQTQQLGIHEHHRSRSA